MKRWSVLPNMRNLLILALLSLLLVSCSGQADAPTPIPFSPDPSEPSMPSSMAVESERNPMGQPGEGFAIYLLAGGMTFADVDAGKPLTLEEQALLTTEDMLAYRQEGHALMLNEAGYQKIAVLGWEAQGKAFAVCVDREIVYTGAFWVAFSSMSIDGVVIDPLEVKPESMFIHISLGYPTEQFFDGEDPRSDPRILDALEEAGKLK